MKGTVISNFVNVKTMDGNPLTTGLAMQIGDYVFGELSAAGTDIVEIDHFYRSGGARIPLDELCKVGTANMRLENVSEPGGDPPTDPPPSTESPFVAAFLVRADGMTIEFIPKV